MGVRMRRTRIIEEVVSNEVRRGFRVTNGVLEADNSDEDDLYFNIQDALWYNTETHRLYIDEHP